MKIRQNTLCSAVIAASIGTWSQPGLANAVDGAWSNLIDWPHIAVSAAALPNGDIVTWSSNRVDSFPNNNGLFTFSSVYDPVTGAFENSNHADHDMFCAGISQLADGNIFASGGNSSIRTSSIFAEDTHDWSLSDPMAQPRWYGTNLTLGNGDVMSTFARGAQVVPEVWSPNVGWSSLPGASMQGLVTEQNAVNAAGITGATTAQWYAFMHTAPDGRVFHSGPHRTMNWFDPNGLGGVEVAGSRAGETRHRQFGSAVMYDTGQLLISGGADRSLADSATASAMTIDINGPTPVITPVPNMLAPRTNHNSIVLPNGEVLIVGGESRGVLFSDVDSVLPAEIWNPDTRAWREVAAITAPRNYHSVALLMRDGRVLASGGGLCGNCAANHQNSQIYTPPFLYDDNGNLRQRPNIFSAPENAQAGGAFEVTTDSPVTRFTLVRLSSVTHAINTDQRIVEPTVTALSGNRYRLTLPANPNVLLPGNYWLYALDADGTPSVGEPVTIDLGVAPPNAAPTIASPGNQAVRIGDNVSVQLSASDTDGNSLRFTVDNLPAGLNMNVNTGLITGQPNQVQSVQTTATVSDGTLTDTVRFNWTVADQPSGNVLVPGDDVTASVAQSAWRRYTIEPTGSARTLSIDLSNLSADIDLYVRDGQSPTLSAYDCRSWRSGTQAEQCTVEQGANTALHIGVHGYAAGNFNLGVSSASGPSTTTLTVGSSVTATINSGQWAYYTVDNPTGVTGLQTELSNLSADLDLYVRAGANPTLQDYDCRPWAGGTTAEQCALPAGNGAGVVIAVYGFNAGSYELSLNSDGNGGGGGGNGDTLAVGESTSGIVARETWQYFQITGGTAGDNVVINLDELNADADLYVGTGAQPSLQDFACRSFASGTQSEQCSLTLGNGDTWIGIYGFAASSYRLSVSGNQNLATLVPGDVRTATIAQGEWQYYAVDNPANAAAVLATLTGLSADIDLYTKSSGFPGLSDFDCRSYRGSLADEDCTLDLVGSQPTIGVYGFRAGSYTLSLNATVATRAKQPNKLDKGMTVKAAVTSTTPISVGGLSWMLLLLPAIAWVRRTV